MITSFRRFLFVTPAFAGMTIGIAGVTAFLLVVPSFAGSWGREGLWNDGRAEVAFYDSERVVYDKPRPFKEQLITVKEDLREDTLVNADNPKAQKTIRVFKLNDVQKFDTENYPYSYLASVFVKEEPVSSVVKITIGSQEWRGNTFKIYKNGSLQVYSYFDGEADQNIPLDLKEGDLFEDQLALSLRALPFKEGFELSTRIWSLLMTNHGQKPEPVEAVIRVTGEEIVRTRAGSVPSWAVKIKKGPAEDTYWFEKKSPHILTKMVTADGRKRLLTGRSRWSYWDRRLPKPNILY